MYYLFFWCFRCLLFIYLEADFYRRLHLFGELQDEYVLLHK